MIRSNVVIGLFFLATLILTVLGSCSGEGEQVRLLESVVDKDTTPPMLLSISPLDGDTLVPVRKPIQAVFSEDIDSGSVNELSFVISPEVNASRQVCRTIAACTVWSELAYRTQYTVTLTTAMTDLAGNSPDADFSWSFITREPPPPPVITDLTPAWGPIGRPITIVGTGFDTLWWENIVWFTGDSDVILCSTDTTIVTVVPEKATTGPVTVRNRVATDTSDFDFTIATIANSPSGRQTGTFSLTRNFETDSADTFSQFVTVDWIPSGIYIMRLDTTRQPESERIFCDIGGSFELDETELVLDVDVPNYTVRDCDTTLSTDGSYIAADWNDTLWLFQYIPELRLYKEFILAN